MDRKEQTPQPGSLACLPRDDLQEKTGIITGAGSGIGWATALYLGRLGCRLVLADLRLSALEELAGEMDRLEAAPPLCLEVDVSKREQVESLVQQARRHLGRIDFLVTCAGILSRAGLLEVEPEEWDRVMEVNLKGVFLCCKAVAPVMVEQGSGSIVNVASIAGRTPAILGGAAYTASKHGVVGLSRHMARELGPRGVRVNAFCPGATYTPMVYENTTAEERAPLEAATPLRRWAEPDEQAAAIAFLVSDDSSFITGACLDSNGGALMI